MIQRFNRLNPVLIFTPYLFLYVLFWAFELPISVLKPLFLCLHLVIAAYLIGYLYRARKNIQLWELGFWLLLFGFFFFPGAYLEYPADPWEHFRRLFRWQTVDFIHQTTGDNKWKFAYFWGWTILDILPFDFRRLGLDFYSAFWQLFFSLQIYRLSLRLSAKKNWAYLCVIACSILFGTNLFSFRYYALSSTPLAMGAYFETLIITLDYFKTGKKVEFYKYLLLIPLTALNHFQEVGFIILGNSSLWAGHLFEKQTSEVRKKFLRTALGLIVISFFLGVLLMQHGPFSYRQMPSDTYTFWGAFKVWHPTNLMISETLGVSGWLALIFSVFLLRKNLKASFFFLAPFFLLIFPPTVYVLTKTLDYGVIYRLLYAAPLPIALTLGFQFLNFSEKKKWGFAVLTIAVLSFPYSYPWRGRLKFQIYKTPPERSFSHLDPMPKWFFKNRDIRSTAKCIYFTDPVTNFVLMTHIGGDEEQLAPRFKPFKYSACSDEKWVENMEFTRRVDHFCGVLVHRPGTLPQISTPWVGPSSGHWIGDQGDQSYFGCEERLKNASDLEKLGWMKTEVPPFYDLYEPPSS